ncbi:hypothetical protein FVE85_5290 [Porphyridium purpureum]|uniref:Uncharacterized protein n=1 Tax=Porphyridium purpureum TaxID=35688 RepID=A0A5J4Z343_PORPP|nr:hypothetical protein FVE85_5290 [Porphyridium purpureum]|eukprot:POR9318..scf295_1
MGRGNWRRGEETARTWCGHMWSAELVDGVVVAADGLPEEVLACESALQSSDNVDEARKLVKKAVAPLGHVVAEPESTAHQPSTLRFASMREFVGSFKDRAAYTTVCTYSAGSAVACLDFHVARLQDSVRMLREDEIKCHPENQRDSDIPFPTQESLKDTFRAAAKLARLMHAKELAHGRQREAVIVVVIPVVGECFKHIFVRIQDCEPVIHPDAVAAGGSIDVELRLHPRRLAEAKDAKWVEERQYLERTRAAGAAETILYNAQGEVLEGTVTNVFVRYRGGIWRTAQHGILYGHVREKVLAVMCDSKLGLDVRLEPPSVNDVGEWECAFLTNATKICQAIARAHFPFDADFHTAKAESERDLVIVQLDAFHPEITRIRRAVIDAICQPSDLLLSE